MKSDLTKFKENVDAWIKHINEKFEELSDLPSVTLQNIENIDHNYELIKELNHKIEILRQENNALKLIQLIQLKRDNTKHLYSKKPIKRIK